MDTIAASIISIVVLGIVAIAALVYGVAWLIDWMIERNKRGE